MKIVHNKNDEKAMNTLTGFEPVHNRKIIDLLLASTLPPELSILTICFVHVECMV